MQNLRAKIIFRNLSFIDNPILCFEINSETWISTLTDSIFCRLVEMMAI